MVYSLKRLVKVRIATEAFSIFLAYGMKMKFRINVMDKLKENGGKVGAKSSWRDQVREIHTQ
jgi:hypothetical protein